jgi:hypothetical protein
VFSGSAARAGAVNRPETTTKGAISFASCIFDLPR